MYPGVPDYLAVEMTNREAQKKASQEAEALADSLRSEKGGFRIDVEPVVVGNPAVELVRIADEHSAGLIVVGSHGLSGIERFLLGSVSERVLRHAHCSVLIVK
jgi:nucleotide-binding universal stress UspA family protein